MIEILAIGIGWAIGFGGAHKISEWKWSRDRRLAEESYMKTPHYQTWLRSEKNRVYLRGVWG